MRDSQGGLEKHRVDILYFLWLQIRKDRFTTHAKPLRRFMPIDPAAGMLGGHKNGYLV
jgi:hypothetical protein